MKRIYLIILLLLVGCSYDSSYDDCFYDCKTKVHNDICDDYTDIWDGCTDQQKEKRDRLCFDECKGK